MMILMMLVTVTVVMWFIVHQVSVKVLSVL